MFVDWCKATDDRPGHMLVLHKGGGPIPRYWALMSLRMAFMKWLLLHEILIDNGSIVVMFEVLTLCNLRFCLIVCIGGWCYLSASLVVRFLIGCFWLLTWALLFLSSLICCSVIHRGVPSWFGGIVDDGQARVLIIIIDFDKFVKGFMEIIYSR